MKLILVLTALLSTAATILLYLYHPPFIASLNNRMADTVVAQAPARPASRSVIVVEIDDKSLTRYGQWPWPRPLLARLLNAIAASGAGSIGLDMLLAEPDRTNVSLSPNVPPASPPAAELAAPDRLLAGTLSKGPYVLGYSFTFIKRVGDPGQECNLHPPGLILVNSAEPDPFFTAKGVTCNLTAFSDAVSRSGFMNAAVDTDGLLRRLPMLIRFGDDLYPSVTLAMLMQHLKIDQLQVVLQRTSGRVDLMLGKRNIELDGHGNLIMRFSESREATTRVSARAVLAGEHAPEQFRDKIVLVGFSAAGLELTYQTVAGLKMPVEIHAQALENLLSDEQVIRTNHFLVWESMMGVAVAAIAAVAVVALPILPSAMISALLIAANWIGINLVFRHTGYLFSPLLPTVLLLTNYAVLTILKSWMALAEKQRQLERINLNLEQRVAEAVSDLRQKDQMMIQQGRQAAMGEMLNNIAHQWRQPLNTLALIVQELRLTYGSKDFNKQTLDASVAKAMETIKHMSQTIEDFRDYFKPDKVRMYFKAEHAVAKTVVLAEANLKRLEISVEVREKRSAEIYGFPNEYSQVLLNILMNSRDAFETQGANDQRRITIEVGMEAGKSVVTITDNAGGIPPEIIERIFDPYFTTKGPDKGTGIGLYMAKSIIENNMGGKLSVRNTGDGAEFRIEV